LNRAKQPIFWKYTTAVLVVALLVVLHYGGSPFGSSAKASAETTGSLSNLVVMNADDAGQKAFGFIKSKMLPPGTAIELRTVSEISGLYALNLGVNGREFKSYVSKDGKFLFPTGIDMDEVSSAAGSADVQNPPEKNEIVKSEKPKIELFWMARCPFGTQSMKGLIPVLELLGDKVDFNLRFVYYSMHGEKEVKEQLNEYCIQKEQKDKLLDYLKCYLKDGEGKECLVDVGIDEEKLKVCTETADKEFSVSANLENKSSWLSGRFPKFDIDKELNEKYGVRGSPTFVLNGVSVRSSRDPASYLSVICDAFDEKPEECSTKLSSEASTPGFGFEGAGGNSAATCS